LNVFPILIPPLRERLDDLPALVDHLIKKHESLSQNRVTRVSPAVYPSMMSYQWRGNIRELENLVKRAIIKSSGDTVESLELPTNAAAAPPSSVLPEGPPGMNAPRPQGKREPDRAIDGARPENRLPKDGRILHRSRFIPGLITHAPPFFSGAIPAEWHRCLMRNPGNPSTCGTRATVRPGEMRSRGFPQ
jgi:DNA-binding NtrC family response regulator